MFIRACIITVNDVDSFIFEDHNGYMMKVLNLVQKNTQKMFEFTCGIVGSGYPDQITMVTIEEDFVHKELVTPISQAMQDWIDENAKEVLYHEICTNA